MLKRASMIVAIIIMNSNAGAAKPASPTLTDLDIRLGETVEMTINNQPVRFRMAPDAISVPTLNGDAATRVGLKPSMIGFVYVIGPVRIGFRTDKVQYGVGESVFHSRTAFSNRQLVEGADGVAGPTTFAYRRVIFTLRDPQAGDRAIRFQMDTDMGDSQTGVKIDVAGRVLHAAFSIDRTESLVTATGGRWIADAHGGRFDGNTRDAAILYGVSRPIRSLRLERPLLLGELEVRNLAVRVSDVGSTQGIADSTAPEPNPDEIVVTAESKRKIPNQRLYIGLDTIGHCASITYDFKTKTVTLMCPNQPPAASQR